MSVWGFMSLRGRMRGYSWPKEDFREKIILKYNSEKMKEFVLVTTPDCSKCRFIKKTLEDRCDKNWYKFKEMQYAEWMPEITSVPTAMIWEDIILDYEWIIELISNKRSFY